MFNDLRAQNIIGISIFRSFPIPNYTNVFSRWFKPVDWLFMNASKIKLRRKKARRFRIENRYNILKISSSLVCFDIRTHEKTYLRLEYVIRYGEFYPPRYSSSWFLASWSIQNSNNILPEVRCCQTKEPNVSQYYAFYLCICNIVEYSRSYSSYMPIKIIKTSPPTLIYSCDDTYATYVNKSCCSYTQHT